MAGILYGVGVGPGDPELMTIKAKRTIETCDIIGIPAESREKCTAYDIALGVLPGIAEKEVVAVTIPMTTDSKTLETAYRDGCDALIKQLERGRSIAFLNLGDPTIYGTYMNIHKYVIQSGYRAELVNGVPSFCAVAAALSVPLGSRNEAVHILPGYYTAGGISDRGRRLAADTQENFDGQSASGRPGLRDYLEQGDTVVLMKSADNTARIKQELTALSEQGICRAYAVTNCGFENQVICRDIRELDENAGYFTTIVAKKSLRFPMQFKTETPND